MEVSLLARSPVYLRAAVRLRAANSLDWSATRHKEQKQRILLSDYIPESPGPECYYLGMLTAGFVLVGGRSRRMGRDKALLPWKSGVLVEDIASTLAAVTANVALVGDPARYGHLRYPCIPDVRGGLGPLSGIEAALQSAHGELNLILACDMPGVQSSHLRKLLAVAVESGEQCVVTADSSGDIHPLCAVYRSACLPPVRKALDEGRLKLMDLTADLHAKVVSAANPVCNLNTIEEWNVVRSADVY